MVILVGGQNANIVSFGREKCWRKYRRICATVV